MQKNNVREKFKIYYQDGIVFYLEQTNTTPESATAAMDKITKILSENAGPKLIFLDLSSSSMPPVKARKIFVQMMKQSQWDKVGILVTNTMVRTIAKFILSAAGAKNLKFFSEQESLLSWLNKND